MKICFFGAFDENRNVNRVFLDGLKKIKNIEIITVNFSTPNLVRDFLTNQKHIFTLSFFRNFINRNINLIKKYFKSNYYDIDCIYIGYPGHESIYFAYFLRILSWKLFNRKIPIIFNPYTSLIDSVTMDYRKLKKKSFLAKLYYLIEWIAFHLSDLIISQSNMEKYRFCELFHLNPKKIFRIFLGVNEVLFYPQKYEGFKDKFVIGFNGNYIPLHGIEYIIKSAKRIEQYTKDIIFEIVGGTKSEIFEKKKIVKKLGISNISFFPQIPINLIPQTIARSDIQLGVFGSTLKARRVIPNKVYTALAMRKPIITANTKAINELLTHQKNCYLCKIADPDSLANSIITLYENEKLRNEIALNGYELFQKKLNSAKLSKKLINMIKNYKNLK